MASSNSHSEPPPAKNEAQEPQREIERTIIIQPPPISPLRKWALCLLAAALVVSLLTNFGMYSSYREYFSDSEPPEERFHSGNKRAETKIALVRMTGTVMPPFTGRTIKSIQAARDDDDVKGVILVVDSPGGLVADSHQIYHELQKLRKQKPVAVVMKRMAASGGYYIAMGGGPDAPIYAEPTTWTGSIGVIIPRYNARRLLEDKLGVSSEPLKTGRYKDSLSPFRDVREDELALWREILNDAFNRFLNVIAENRKSVERMDSRLLGWNAGLTLVLRKRINQPAETTVEHYATGQVFTAKQALKAGLIDRIGYLDDAIAEMKDRIEEKDVRVVQYHHPTGLLTVLLSTAEARQPERQWEQLRDLTVPRPMYYCTSLPLLPAPATRHAP